jgi:uncharacterized protein (DUF927 family)
MATIDRLGLDNRIDYREFYRQRLRNFKDKGDELVADCPFHNDTKQHFYINAKTGQYHCKVCNEAGNAQTFLEKTEHLTPQEAYQKLLKIAGIEPKSTQKKPKVDYFSQYAEMKKLPKDFLQSLGIKNANIGISIPYMDEAGVVVATKKRRISDGSGPRFTWNRGAKLLPYGLWRLKEIREAGYCILVEGESDSQTLWYHGFQALGIPGAGSFKNEWVDYIRDVPKIYIHQEPGEGGEAFLKQICGKLLDEGYRGKVYVIHTPGYKDPSDLHVADPNGFKATWQKVLESARELNLADFEPRPEEIIPNAPIRLRLPVGWIVNENGVYKQEKDGLLLVCPVPILITKRLRNIDTGNEKIEIHFRRDNQDHYIRANRSTVFQNRTITQLADRGLPVTSENAKKLVKYLGDLEAENMKLIPVQRSTEQMGWVSSSIFIPGADGDVVLDVDEGSAYIAAAYHPEGSPDEWKNAAVQARAISPIARFVLAASFAAPLLSILNQRVFVVHCWGPSRGGKTAAIKLALSVWGNPETLLMNFNATKVALERLASFFNDLPLGIDEKQVAGDKQGFVEGLIYLLGLGKGRARGTKTGWLQQFKYWRTIALTSGEEPISTASSHTGIITRTLELRGQPIPDERFAAKLHDIVVEHYGHAGPVFIRKLIEFIKDNPEDIKALYESILEHLDVYGAGKLGSHKAAVATVCVGDILSSMWIFGHEPAIAKSEAMELAEFILDSLQDYEEADYAERAKEWLDSWIAQHWANFGDDAKERFGWVKPDGIAILPSALEPAMKKEGFSPTRVYSDFAERGWILGGDGRHIKRKIQIENKQYRVIFYTGLDRDDDEEEIPF